RVPQHARVPLQDVVDDREGLREVGVVRNADVEVHLTNRAVVVEDLADDLAIGYGDDGTVAVHEFRGKQLDVGDLAVDAEQLDVLADLVRLGEDDGQAGDEVAEHSL